MQRGKIVIVLPALALVLAVLFPVRQTPACGVQSPFPPEPGTVCWQNSGRAFASYGDDITAKTRLNYRRVIGDCIAILALAFIIYCYLQFLIPHDRYSALVTLAAMGAALRVVGLWGPGLVIDSRFEFPFSNELIDSLMLFNLAFFLFASMVTVVDAYHALRNRKEPCFSAYATIVCYTMIMGYSTVVSSVSGCCG